MIASSLVIRPFHPEDQSYVRALILRGLVEHFGVADESRNPDLSDIEASFLRLGHIFLVGESNGQLVATAGLLLNGSEAQIVRVSVAPAHRRRGFAYSLVMALLAHARQHGIRRVWMETNDDWEAAIVLYQRCGFTRIAHRDGCVFMELRLPRN